MCNALILSMLSVLVSHTSIAEHSVCNVFFWVCWFLALIANTSWWKKIEHKLTKGE